MVIDQSWHRQAMNFRHAAGGKALIGPEFVAVGLLSIDSLDGGILVRAPDIAIIAVSQWLGKIELKPKMLSVLKGPGF